MVVEESRKKELRVHLPHRDSEFLLYESRKKELRVEPDYLRLRTLSPRNPERRNYE